MTLAASWASCTSCWRGKSVSQNGQLGSSERSLGIVRPLGNWNLRLDSHEGRSRPPGDLRIGDIYIQGRQLGQAKARGTREERIKKLHEEFGVRPISRERFNAFVSWTRSPIATGVSKELEVADERNRSWGDRTDRDFAYVVLGRDESRFRCIDVNVAISL